MNKLVDIEKSFYMIGTSHKKCFDCKYCRATDSQENIVSYNILPTEINKNLSNVPVAINLYYGDPMLYKKSTYDYLKQLQKTEHKGPIIIITKGSIDVSWLKDDTFIDLDLHIAFSTFGLEHEYDDFSHNMLIENLKVNIPHKRSIEFRPVCYKINDSEETIEGVFKIANQYGLSIGYSGLQGKPETQDYWNKNNIILEPYPGFHFGHKKSMSEEVQAIFDNLSIKYNVPIFRKTSCLISHVHNLERDYNSHYYRPNEMNCWDCVMKDKCFDYKSKLTRDKSKIEHLVPFDFDIIYKKNHQCILKTQGVCEFSTPDCSKIEGNIIKIDKVLTTADIRVIKWLTGYTVDARFEESQYINDDWFK
jgi:hypothetical protein